MRILSEEEINEDLKYNYPGMGVTLNKLVKPGNPFCAQNIEEAKIGYSCGYSIREFLLEEGFRLSFSSRELLPIVFNVYGMKELNEICGGKRVDDLRDLGVVNFELFGFGSDIRKVAFYVNNFEDMKRCLKKYAYDRGFVVKKFSEKFEKNLGSLKLYVDQISERSFEVYKVAKEWYNSHKDLKGFEFKPKPLFLALTTEESLVVV